jgi:hypothetical protein
MTRHVDAVAGEVEQQRRAHLSMPSNFTRADRAALARCARP